MKETRGYRRKRLPQPEPDPPPTVQDFKETLLGSDAVARIVAEAASKAVYPPEPEDLLVMWAKQYYAGGGDQFVWQIGYYVAEDLKLRGLVDGG